MAVTCGNAIRGAPGLGKRSSVVLACSRGFPCLCVVNPFWRGLSERRPTGLPRTADASGSATRIAVWLVRQAAFAQGTATTEACHAASQGGQQG